MGTMRVDVALMSALFEQSDLLNDSTFTKTISSQHQFSTVFRAFFMDNQGDQMSS
jgi:hypothetical protein